MSWFQQQLRRCIKLASSDLHLSCDCLPTFRIKGQIYQDNQSQLVQAEQLQQVFIDILTPAQKKLLQENRQLDMGYSCADQLRFRINIYYERNRPAMAIRWLDGSFRSLSELNLPKSLQHLTHLKDGLVLITGATGSGKSTTLASIINEINRQRHCHILTLEDPIEFVHANQNSVVHQREVGFDVPTYAMGIKAALREDPDVILLGEMRDAETIHAALSAAETGHLVFSTLHTNDAVGVIDRLVGAFAGAEQDSVRQQLSTCLRAVVTQTLVKHQSNNSRLPVNEILFVNTAVANLIRKHKPDQIRSMMESGRALGNQTFEYALAQRVMEKSIDKDSAQRLARYPENLEAMITLLSKLRYQQRGEPVA